MLSTVPITSLLSRLSAARLQGLFSQSPQCTAEWLRAIAQEGVAQAQLCYGQMLLDGIGTPKNDVAAFQWFRRAAAQDDPDAVNMVGRCLENGWGTAQDPVLAARYYHRAADRGHAWAQYNLGHLYLDGVGVTRDARRAYLYYLEASARRHARAMNLAGRCCEEGWGTPRDFPAAARWYRYSAEAGYFRGQYNWASVLLACGRPDEAALWLERAMRSGTPGVKRAGNALTTLAFGHVADHGTRST